MAKRLIDAKALMEHIKDLPTWWPDEGSYYMESMKYPQGMFEPDDIISSIENAPTVNAVEEVHGKWIIGTGENALERGYRMCSVCGEIIKTQYSLFGMFNYCHYCGAEMDGGNIKSLE